MRLVGSRPASGTDGARGCCYQAGPIKAALRCSRANCSDGRYWARTTIVALRSPDAPIATNRARLSCLRRPARRGGQDAIESSCPPGPTSGLQIAVQLHPLQNKARCGTRLRYPPPYPDTNEVPNRLPNHQISVFAGNSTNGASRDRTGDLLLAKQALSQLSYGPTNSQYTPCAADSRSFHFAVLCHGLDRTHGLAARGR